MLAAVHGPRWASGPESPDGLVVDVVVNGSGFSYSDESALKSAVQGCVDPLDHPRANVLVALVLEHCDGSVLACACNAAIAALVDAGVSCPRPITAASLSVCHDGTLLLDSTRSEEESNAAACNVSAAFLIRSEQGALSFTLHYVSLSMQSLITLLASIIPIPEAMPGRAVALL